MPSPHAEPIAYLVTCHTTAGTTSRHVLKQTFPDLPTALAAMLRYTETWPSVTLTPCPGWHRQGRRLLAAGLFRQSRRERPLACDAPMRGKTALRADPC